MAFRYVMFKLIEWYKIESRLSSDSDFNRNNDLSILKVMKLLYFTTAVNAKNNSLLEIFDKYVAMPYGHVESDIYDLLKFQTNLDGIIINKDSQVQDTFEPSINLIRENNSRVAGEIDAAIELLKNYNTSRFILFKPFEYVDMSHALNSWKVFYNKAQVNGSYSLRIDPSYIYNDGQYFILQHTF